MNDYRGMKDTKLAKLYLMEVEAHNLTKQAFLEIHRKYRELLEEKTGEEVDEFIEGMAQAEEDRSRDSADT